MVYSFCGITLPQKDKVSFETWEETLKLTFFGK